MKKIVYFVMLLFLIVSLSACSNNVDTQESSDSSVVESTEEKEVEQPSSKKEPATILERKVLEWKENIAKLNNHQSIEEGSNIPDVVENGASSGYLTPENVGYVIMDIDGNGYNDLIFGNIDENSIYSIFSESEDTPNAMTIRASAFENSEIWLCEDAVLRYLTFLDNSPNGNGVESTYVFEKFGTSTAINGGTELAVVSTAWGDYYTSRTRDKNEQISVEEFNEIINSYPVVQLGLIPLENY